METFRKALKIARDYGESITIGGGEPTLVENFEAMMYMAIAANDSGGGVFIATNGTHTERALALAKFNDNVIMARLSGDNFHNLKKVNKKVVEIYRKQGKMWCDGPRKADTLVAAGRAKGISGARKGCPCEDLIIEPNGAVKQCGCDNAPILGNVNTRWRMPDERCCVNETY